MLLARPERLEFIGLQFRELESPGVAIVESVRVDVCPRYPTICRAPAYPFDPRDSRTTHAFDAQQRDALLGLICQILNMPQMPIVALPRYGYWKPSPGMR